MNYASWPKLIDIFPYAFPINSDNLLQALTDSDREWLHKQSQAHYEPAALSDFLVGKQIVQYKDQWLPYRYWPDDKAAKLMSAAVGGATNLSQQSGIFVIVMHLKRDDLFYYAAAILHAPTYRIENAAALEQEWPHLPLLITHELARSTCLLGRQLAALIDLEIDVPGVTSGEIREPLRSITISEAEQDSGDLLRTVPESVWNYRVGGQRVIEKWLKDRLTERPEPRLTGSELTELQTIVRRIAAIQLLEPELDVNYLGLAAMIARH